MSVYLVNVKGVSSKLNSTLYTMLPKNNGTHFFLYLYSFLVKSSYSSTFCRFIRLLKYCIWLFVLNEQSVHFLTLDNVAKKWYNGLKQDYSLVVCFMYGRVNSKLVYWSQYIDIYLSACLQYAQRNSFLLKYH